jgi:hypothetical protein
MAGARINLVRVDDLEATESLDVESGATTYDQHDEVEIITPQGEAAAMVVAAQFTDSDIRYEYTNGGVGISPRRRRHTIQLAVDYIGDAVRAKLERWMHDRALLRYCPGFGRYTDLAYRPLAGAGSTLADGLTTLTDLTGRHNITTVGDSTNNYWWDSDLRVMREFSGTNPRRVVATPAGAGQVCESAKTNLHNPGSPVSATQGQGAGLSGWTRTGANYTDMTLSLASGAFGHDDMPHALRVQVADGASRDRTMYANWATLTGSGYATASVWVKGRLPRGAFAQLYQSGDENDEDGRYYFDGVDTSEWTKVSLSYYSADWSAANMILRIRCNSDSDGGSGDFLIGPSIVEYDGTGAAASPEWAPYNTAATASYMRVADYNYPTAGAVAVSLWWPAGAVVTNYAYPLWTSAVDGVRVYNDQLRFYRTATEYLSGAITPRKGAVNTVIATWQGGALRLYFNGALVDSSTSTETETLLGGSASTLVLGGYSSLASHPLIPLSWRIDRRAWTATEAVELDAAMRDPVAVHVAAQARGRQYRIAQLPGTPRNQSGGTVWTGGLVLEEHSYDANWSDITTAEVY